MLAFFMYHAVRELIQSVSIDEPLKIVIFPAFFSLLIGAVGTEEKKSKIDAEC
jgi:hypothetical protein